MFSLLFFVLTTFATVAFAKTVTYNFDIGWVTAAPDGYSRQVIGINGQWPVPMIEANVGDTIVVNAKNSLGNQATSLHFHGMFQQGSAQSDGPVALTQCAIQPGDSYTYSFVANPAGTHWYHSHNKGQYPDGLRGKMVIHDTAWESSLGIDSQMTYSMSDWYHRQFSDIITDYMSPSNQAGIFPSPDSILFDDKKQAQDIKIAPGKKYLIRIVNIGSVACGQFHIEGYTLNVVETDGVQVHSAPADTILICAGQSYGVVVQGKSSSLGAPANANYVVKLSTDMFTESAPPANQITIVGNVVATLLGSLFSLIDNILNINWTPSSTFDDFNLKPLDGQKLLSPVSNHIDMTVNQSYIPGIGNRYALGGSQPWVPQQVPSLFTALTTGNAAMDPATYGPGSNPWIVKSGDIVQIYLQNPTPYPHPMHLHGHVFQIVARGSGTWNGNEGAMPSVPEKRDGAVMPANGYLVLRFQANNPGVWFFHCHIDLHLTGGMAATIVEAPNLLQGQSVTSASQGLCSAAGSKSSGNCAGGQGEISASDAASKCNTVLNYKGPNNAVVS